MSSFITFFKQALYRRSDLKVQASKPAKKELLSRLACWLSGGRSCLLCRLLAGTESLDVVCVCCALLLSLVHNY